MQKRKKIKHEFGRNKKNTHVLIRFDDDNLKFMREYKDKTSVEFRHMANEGMKLYAEKVRQQQTA